MGNSSSLPTRSLSLLRIPVGDKSVDVYADPVVTERENPGSEISVMNSEIKCPIDLEGGVVALAVWPGAVDLVHNIDVDFSGKRVLELGCGVGLPGMFISKYCQPLEVVLTDRESARMGVEASIVANNTQKICRFEPFDWGSGKDLKAYSTEVFDYIIGSEIVYAEEQDPLVNALLAVTCASPATRIILSYRNRSESDEEYFNSKILVHFQIEKRVSDRIFVLKKI